jgi:hypothetical protein
VHNEARFLSGLSVQKFAGGYKCLLAGIAVDACEKNPPNKHEGLPQIKAEKPR